MPLQPACRQPQLQCNGSMQRPANSCIPSHQISLVSACRTQQPLQVVSAEVAERPKHSPQLGCKGIPQHRSKPGLQGRLGRPVGRACSQQGCSRAEEPLTGPEAGPPTVSLPARCAAPTCTSPACSPSFWKAGAAAEGGNSVPLTSKRTALGSCTCSMTCCMANKAALHVRDLL